MGICEGKVVIVTGAGRGIGRGHAIEFALERRALGAAGCIAEDGVIAGRRHGDDCVIHDLLGLFGKTCTMRSDSPGICTMIPSQEPTGDVLSHE